MVVGNGFGGVLLHEAVGHGLEADAVQSVRASTRGGGEQVAAPFLTAYDDGSRVGDWGSDGVDDEGTPTRRTTLIEGGGWPRTCTTACARARTAWRPPATAAASPFATCRCRV